MSVMLSSPKQNVTATMGSQSAPDEDEFGNLRGFVEAESDDDDRTLQDMYTNQSIMIDW